MSFLISKWQFKEDIDFYKMVDASDLSERSSFIQVMLHDKFWQESDVVILNTLRSQHIFVKAQIHDW